MIKALVVSCILLPSIVCAQVKKQKAVVTPAINTKVAFQASMARGKIVYTANCLTCHQIDGSGVPNLNPPLVRTKWVLGDKTVLIKQIINGSKGKIEIDGDSFHNAMPPLAQLTDEQIADVITYVRNSFRNKASAVSPQQVKMVRQKSGSNKK